MTRSWGYFFALRKKNTFWPRTAKPGAYSKDLMGGYAPAPGVVVCPMMLLPKLGAAAFDHGLILTLHR
jgi:hypothetical protein